MPYLRCGCVGRMGDGVGGIGELEAYACMGGFRSSPFSADVSGTLFSSPRSHSVATNEGPMQHYSETGGKALACDLQKKNCILSCGDKLNSISSVVVLVDFLAPPVLDREPRGAAPLSPHTTLLCVYGIVCKKRSSRRQILAIVLTYDVS